MTTNYVDYKVTVWRRAYFDSSANMELVVDAIKESSDILTIFEEGLGFNYDDICYESEELITVEDNNNASTIEVYENDELIYENSIK